VRFYDKVYGVVAILLVLYIEMHRRRDVIMQNYANIVNGVYDNVQSVQRELK